MLLTACPSFRPAWDRYAVEPTFDPDLPYIHAGEFARHVVALIESQATTEFPAIFHIIEQLHVKGDAYVRELATIGLLEALQNNGANRLRDVDVFRAYLEPATREAWDALKTFWSEQK